jgi:hemerythrin-like domain-containing protein
VKRAAALVPLSREHHEALVLARRACDPARPDAEPMRLREHILRRWTEHFEPHFATEEEVLFAALAAAGAREDAAEALRQHAHLRGLVAQLRRGDAAALPAWGDALRAHVQWEERELFPRAERLLDLASLREALQRAEEEK